ncbi:MAG TPA: urate hydroxylase PuuD [Burkholderiales bacterium]|nr:urate hydroxylase PuuD [Burkholderiales bacterium]
MGFIFQSLGRTVLAGIVILLVMMGIANTFGMMSEHGYWQFFMRWLHILSGVMWIGLLWYFNFVQTPSMPKIPDAEKPAVSKVIAPTALFWFRWSALATVITGALLAWMGGFIVQALTLQPGARAIGVGMWMALVMAFNVWFIIWPNQKKVLGLVTVEAAQKAAAGKLAGMASRFNTMLSIPMLYCMAAQSHGGF